MSRAFLNRSLPLLGLLLVGVIVLAVAGDSTVGFAIGFALIGAALVILIGLFFYETGRSEDRARAAERRRPRRNP